MSTHPLSTTLNTHLANTHLTSERIRTILHAVDARQHLTLRSNEDAEPAYTILMGADMIDGKLLLSEPFPAIQCLDTQHFWLQIKAEHQHLMLKIAIETIENGYLIANLLDTHWSNNKRWNTRHNFLPRQGPKVEMLHMADANAHGFLHDLSELGAAVDFWGLQYKDTFRETHGLLRPQMTFNSCFELQCNARILSTHFYRSPCCHLRVRLLFEDLNDIQQSQLHSLLNWQREATQHRNIAQKHSKVY